MTYNIANAVIDKKQHMYEQSIFFVQLLFVSIGIINICSLKIFLTFSFRFFWVTLQKITNITC